MSGYDQAQQVKELINTAQSIVIIQADNPDGDSLGSALALEQIISDLGKDVHLYCGVDIPDYLKHLRGWDRVSKDMPSKIDASIIVDTSAIMLLEKLEHSEYRGWVASKPVIVLDHHAEVKCDIPYAKVVINDKEAVATGEVIYSLANQLGWSLNLMAKTQITSSILSDSLGLSSEGTTPTTYRTIADLVESGVDRPALEEARRAFSKMQPEIFKYKAELIKRTMFEGDGRIAVVTVPQDELDEYSPLYNPAPLIQADMLQTEGVLLAIVFKSYKAGKTTAAIRTNVGGAIADKLALHFGGGGHAYAAGFKVEDGRSIEEIKTECLKIAEELLNETA